MGIIPPFADDLKATMPTDRTADFAPALADLLGGLGFIGIREGHWQAPDGIGKVDLRCVYGVAALQVSGSALAACRAAGAFGALVSMIGEGSHRVTGLHAALDVPRAAPGFLRRAYRRGKAGLVTLTRKSVPPTQVRRVQSAAMVGAGDTGTVYLGKRARDVSLVVYDKRQHLLERAVELHGDHPSVFAANDPGPLTRFELKLGRKVGMTLRDVYDPTELFWHFMRRADFLPVPAGVGEWEPRALGFEIARPEPDLMRQLDLLLDRSPDIHRALSIADRLGQHGRTFLLGRLRKLRPVGSVGLSQVSAAAANSSTS